MIKLEQLHADSLDMLMYFDKLCFPTDFWKSEDWKDLIEDERSIYYALLDEDVLIGNVFIYNWKGEKDYIKIMNLSVHPEYRNQGLAHKLLNHVTEEMVKIGMKRFCGETRGSNRGMQTVFEQCGYQLIRVEEHYYHNPDESAYKYVLQL